MQTIFLLGIIIFCLSAGYFSVFRREKNFNTAFLVSALMAASYVMMYNGLLSVESAAGEVIHWSRWAVYALSCSLLMYSMGQKLHFSGKQHASTISLNILVMFTGSLAAVLSGWSMLVLFGLGGYAYLLQVRPILAHKQATAAMKNFILFGWGVFPIIFLLAPEGYGLISSTLAAGLYLALDILTKIVYYFAVQKNK